MEGEVSQIKKELWVKIHGSWDKSGMDEVPEIEIVDNIDDEIELICEQVEQYSDPYGVGDIPEQLRRFDRARPVLDVILEGEDTLFAKVEDAKKELEEMIRKAIIEDGGWEFIECAGYDGQFYRLQRLEDKRG